MLHVAEKMPDPLYIFFLSFLFIYIFLNYYIDRKNLQQYATKHLKALVLLDLRCCRCVADVLHLLQIVLQIVLQIRFICCRNCCKLLHLPFIVSCNNLQQLIFYHFSRFCNRKPIIRATHLQQFCNTYLFTNMLYLYICNSICNNLQQFLQQF